MNALLNPVVAVVVSLAAAVCFAAAAQIHAMVPGEHAGSGDTPALSMTAAVAAGHPAWSALDFWIP
jgi:hypothetical protein